MTTALLIIDVQRALCTGEEAAFGIDTVIATINTLVTQARAASVPVILVQHEESQGSLAFDSAGWQLDDRLAVAADDTRIRKTSPDAFHLTPLQKRLEQDDIDRLVVCGLQSDFCVDATVRRALALGYEIVLVADGHSTVDNTVLGAAQITAHHNVTLGNITSFVPRVTVLPASEVRMQVAGT